jgi:HAD superfamily hydrolase (TIGR01484 family)
MLVSDYDGTFSTSTSDIELNCKLIREFIKDGNQFVLSSGRPLNSLKKQVELYDIPYTHLGTSDGNFLFDKKGNLLEYNLISHHIVRNDILKALKNLKIYEGIQYAYPKVNLNKYYRRSRLGSIAFVIKEKKITDEFLILFDELKRTNDAYDFSVYGYSGIDYFMIRPKGISKSSPIKKLSNKLHISKKHIYTIGDNDNDYELVRDFNGFVIGNNEELNKVALKRYNAVHELVSDIQSKKVLKRW